MKEWFLWSYINRTIEIHLNLIELYVNSGRFLTIISRVGQTFSVNCCIAVYVFDSYDTIMTLSIFIHDLLSGWSLPMHLHSQSPPSTHPVYHDHETSTCMYCIVHRAWGSHCYLQERSINPTAGRDLQHAGGVYHVVKVSQVLSTE